MTVLRRMTIHPPSARLPSPAETKDLTTSVKETLQAETTKTPHAQNIPGGLTESLGATPPSWRSFRPDPPDRDPTNPAFRRLPTNGSVMHDDDAALDACLDAGALAYAAVQALDQKTSDPEEKAILLGELESWKKLTVQRGRISSWHLVDLNPPDATVPSDWEETAAIVAKLIMTAPITDFPPTAPFDTNAGWPCFTTGFGAKACAALMVSTPNPRAILDDGAAFCGLTHLPQSSIQAFGLTSRQGPLYKEQPYLTHQGAGSWMPTLMARGAWSRTRQVFMASYGGNAQLEPLLSQMQAGRRHLPGTWHSGDNDLRAVLAALSQNLHLAESDISGYDQSVSATLQRVAALALKAAAPHLQQEVDTWLFYESRSVISPSRQQVPGATITSTHGGTHSGQRLTAEIGTFIALTTVLTVLHRLIGQPVTTTIQRWLNRDFMLLVQGDDILLGTSQPLDTLGWRDAWREVGFECELLAGLRFLAKHRTARGALPVGGRIVQQTIANENEPIGLEWDPILVLGMQARWGIGPPSIVEPYVRAVLKTTSFAHRTGVYDGPTAHTWLTHPTHARRLQRALDLLKNDAWMQRLRKDAPYSPSAALLLEELTKFGLITEDVADLGRQTLLLHLLPKLYARSATHRIRIAVDLYNLIQSGANDDEQVSYLVKS